MDGTTNDYSSHEMQKLQNHSIANNRHSHTHTLVNRTEANKTMNEHEEKERKNKINFLIFHQFFPRFCHRRRLFVCVCVGASIIRNEIESLNDPSSAFHFDNYIVVATASTTFCIFCFQFGFSFPFVVIAFTTLPLVSRIHGDIPSIVFAQSIFRVLIFVVVVFVHLDFVSTEKMNFLLAFRIYIFASIVHFLLLLRLPLFFSRWLFSIAHVTMMNVFTAICVFIFLVVYLQLSLQLNIDNKPFTLSTIHFAAENSTIFFFFFLCMEKNAWNRYYFTICNESFALSGYFLVRHFVWNWTFSFDTKVQRKTIASLRLQMFMSHTRARQETQHQWIFFFVAFQLFSKIFSSFVMRAKTHTRTRKTKRYSFRIVCAHFLLSDISETVK